MDHFINAILSITRESEKIPKRHFKSQLTVQHKQDDSPVTVADQLTESSIREAITQQFPEHGILGEEYGQSADALETEYLWVIDPIDGTKSFIAGMPLYGMLVALLQRGKPILGLMRMPELNECYLGTADGSFLNTQNRLKTSDVKNIKDAFIFINEGEKLLQDEPRVLQTLCQSGRLTRLGYDCYPHALVASGQIDACVDYDLKPYDYLPLVPIVEGAGGIITDWQGNELDLNSDGNIISAATFELHQAVLKTIQRSPSRSS